LNKLSKETVQILTESGWYPGRKSDITGTSDFLQSKGYQLFPCVADVLREFGGIKYSFNQPNGDKDSFHLIPEEAYGDYYEKEDFEEIEMRVNESLIAIGQVRDDNMMMFISESGKIFGEMGYCLVKFGNHIYEALDTLCLVLPVKKLNK
jgi:hypothetical protein